MQRVASFIIQDTFKITGRGLVFVGIITEGDISTGNYIEFIFSGESLIRKISGIDMPSRTRMNLTGLLISCESEAEMEALRNWIPGEVEAVVWKK